MIRRIALFACVAGAFAGAASAAATDVHVSPVGNARFPERAYRLTLPKGSETARPRVRVTENGDRVSRLTVVPATYAGAGQLAAVLAIDASNSMRGKPIVAAMAAARAFAARRNPQQQLAVVAFNDRVHVLLPFTKNPAAIDRALSQTPALAEGTRLNDGVARSATLLRTAGIGSGSIIVLSDGHDVGSFTTAEKAASKARTAHARVYPVGLRSRSFDAAALSYFGGATGGRYAEATAAELAATYDQLGFELSHEFLVRYRSLAGPKEKVDVRVQVVGLPEAATTSYVTPPLPVGPVPPYQPSVWYRFWRSPASFAVAVLAAIALLGLGLLVVLRPNRDRTIRNRLSEFVSVPGALKSTGRGGALADARDGVGRPQEPETRWERFKEELEIGEVSVSATQIVIGTAIATITLGWLLWFAAGPIAAILCVIVPVVVRTYLSQRVERRRRAFVDQLPDNLAVLSAALRAGHSLLGALSVVVDDAGEPTQTEFRRVIAQEQLGVPLEEALDEVARRMDCRDLEQVGLVAALGRDTGGNTAEVLDRVTDTIRERADLRRLVRTLTTQGRMSRWIVSFLPFGLLIAITLINPEYMQPLYDRAIGRVLLVLAAMMVVAGSLVIRRIVNIKV
jgi:tight adherence protein B